MRGFSSVWLAPADGQTNRRACTNKMQELCSTLETLLMKIKNNILKGSLSPPGNGINAVKCQAGS